MVTQPRPVRPPRVARALVALVTAPGDRDFVLADLDDEHARLQSAAGRRAARAWYWRQAASALRPGLTRRLERRRGATHAARRFSWYGSLKSDVSYAARRLRQAPLVALITTVSLGIGIGAATTVFSVANALLLRSSPAVVDPDGVLSIYTVPKSDPVFGQTSFPDFLAIEEQVQSLHSVAALRLGAVSFGAEETGRSVVVEIVSADFFRVLGVRPALGRTFTGDETRPGAAERVAVVSYEFWQRELGGRSDVLGQQIRLDGQLFAIIGVGPEGLRSRLAEMKLAAWVPAGLPGGFYHATDREIADRADREYSVLARAKPGQSVEQVAAELDALAGRLHGQYRDAWEDDRGQPLSFRVVGANPGMLPPEFNLALAGLAAVVLTGAVFILLIACSNVAGLLLAQGHERRHEIGVRAALGAGRGRLVRMLLVESALVAMAGGAAGMLAARAAISTIGTVSLPVGVPLEFDFSLDPRVLLFAVGISALACLAFGLLPALAGSRAALTPGLTAGRRTQTTGGTLRLRRLLVVGQVTASLGLLAGAGLLLRSTTTILAADLGFEPDKIAVVSKDLSFDGHATPQTMTTLREIASRIEAHPEVESVALATAVERVFDDLTIAGVRPDTYQATEPLLVRMNAVDPEYMTMLRFELAAGRALGAGDHEGADRVALVNEAFAARHWPGQPAVGRTMRLLSMRQPGTTIRGLDEQLTVVGVIRDPRSMSVPESPTEMGASTIVGVNARVWVPLAQHPSTRAVIHARARTSAAAIVAVLREETGVAEVPLIAAQPLVDLISFPMQIQASVGRLMRWGGLFALVLSFLGIYGIVSFMVSERSREMAIRRALGARSDEVVREVMRHGFSLALWGIALGLALTIPIAFLARAELAAIHPLDPVALGGGIGVVLAAALLASAVPARRLASVDPMTVLKDE
jgi:putative ABC transport system permease protein